MKKSFRDPLTNVLKGWGYATANGADLARDEAEDFGLEPGKWQLVNGVWTAYDIPLADKKKKAAERIRFEASDIIRDTILHFPVEYQTAKKAADDFSAAGYPALSVPAMVKAWADAKGWTATAAADDIIAAGNGWLSAQDSIRTNRLKHAEQAKNAIDQAALDSCMASWESFRKTMRANLGI